MRDKNQSIDTNLIIDPGFRCTKTPVAWFPSIVTSWPSGTPGVLDEHTVKITLLECNESSLVGECCLVGNRAKAINAISTLYAYDFEKTDRAIALWTAIAALSYQIPVSVKEVTVDDSWVVFLLFDLDHAEKYKQAIGLKFVAQVDREHDGHRYTVFLKVDWTNHEKMHCLQEGAGALEYVRSKSLMDLDPEGEYGSVNIGGNTVEYIRQLPDGQILQKSSINKGIVHLAKAICDPLSKKLGHGRVEVGKILDAIQEGSIAGKFTYGKSGEAIDFTDILKKSRVNWEKNILGQIRASWDEDLRYIQQIFMHGGSASMFQIENPQYFFFTGSHNPQFVDVCGAKYWAENNLF